MAVVVDLVYLILAFANVISVIGAVICWFGFVRPRQRRVARESAARRKRIAELTD
jgi:hypothetical protein